MNRIFLTFTLLISLSGCIQHVLHQGNVLKPGLVFQIKVDDTRYRVESLLGAPMLDNVFNPNRSTYIEDYHDPETGTTYRRSVDIIYDSANRVSNVKTSGFEDEGHE